MKIVIAGGSGFIGKKLTESLLDAGHDIIILTRKKRAHNGPVTYVQWLHENASPENEIGEAELFINLAGVSINDGRWTTKHQVQIYKSRMTATDELLRIINALHKKPTTLINASAIGLYPASERQIYTEQSSAIADDFLAKTVHDWEKKAASASSLSIRTIFMRFGLVLGNEGGALPLMSMPYKLFVGGTVGSGRQWLSWIHIDDLIRSILFVIKNHQIQGPVNVCSPNPQRMKAFGQTIGKVLRRPHWLPMPGFLMQLILGKKSALVLTGQYIVPAVLKKENFTFKYPELEDALENLFNMKE